MDVARAFTFLFRDQAWPRKAAIGILLMLVPLVGWLAVAGYGMRAARQTARRQDVPLPEWNDWGDLFGDGLRFFGVSIVWGLFGLLLLCPLFGAAAATGSSFVDLAQARWWIVPNYVVGVAYGLVTNAALARASVEQDGMAGTDVPGVFRTVRRGFGGFLIAAVVTSVVGIATGFLGGDAPTEPFLFDGAFGWAATGLSFAISTFYSALYTGHLAGQAYWLAEVRAAPAQTA